MLATAYWATSAQGGVTRQGVVLTYLLSFLVDSQQILLLLLLLQVPYERFPRTCTAGTVALTPARCLLTEDNTTLLDSTVEWRDRGESPSGT